jgi:hypothetical protein
MTVTMEELSAGVQKIFRDAVKSDQPPRSFPLETEKREREKDAYVIYIYIYITYTSVLGCLFSFPLVTQGLV